MHTIALLLACLSCTSHGRRVQTSERKQGNLDKQRNRFWKAPAIASEKLRQIGLPNPHKALALLCVAPDRPAAGWQAFGQAGLTAKRHSDSFISASRVRKYRRLAMVDKNTTAMTDPLVADTRMQADRVTIEKPPLVLSVDKLEKEISADTILRQLELIQKNSSKNVVILGTRNLPYLTAQIVELLSYALVLTDTHIFTSGAAGTHAAAIKGALRAERPDLLTVILPQTAEKQPPDIQELLEQVEQKIELRYNDMSLADASKLCNSELLSRGDQLIMFLFHNSNTLLQTVEEAKSMDLLTSVLFLD